MKQRRRRGPKPPVPYKNADPNERGVLVIFDADDERESAARADARREPERRDLSVREADEGARGHIQLVRS